MFSLAPEGLPVCSTLSRHISCSVGATHIEATIKSGGEHLRSSDPYKLYFYKQVAPMGHINYLAVLGFVIRVMAQRFFQINGLGGLQMSAYFGPGF